jgi:hypothetical protein
MLNRTCGPKTQETTESWKKLYSEDELHSSINIIRMIRSWNMRWAEHIACMEENERHTYISEKT